MNKYNRDRLKGQLCCRQFHYDNRTLHSPGGCDSGCDNLHGWCLLTALYYLLYSLLYCTKMSKAILHCTASDGFLRMLWQLYLVEQTTLLCLSTPHKTAMTLSDILYTYHTCHELLARYPHVGGKAEHAYSTPSARSHRHSLRTYHTSSSPTLCRQVPLISNCFC